MPNTLTSIFRTVPSTEPAEAPHPNTGVYVTGTQLADGTWQVIHTLITKTATPLTMTGRLKNFPAITAAVVASGNILNNQQPAPTAVSAVGSGATSISVTGNSGANASAYRFLSGSAQAGPFTLLVSQASATYAHTGLTAGAVVWYQMQYVGGGFYDDSPVSVAFSGTAAAAANAAPTGLLVNNSRLASYTAAASTTGTDYEYATGSAPAYAALPAPTLTAGRIGFAVPGTAQDTVLVRLKAVGAGSPGAQATAVVNRTAWNGPKVQLIQEGDSITFGYSNPQYAASLAYPAQLNALFGATNYQVVNVATSGERTDKMLADGPAQLDAIYSMATYSFDFCSLLGGVNDLNNISVSLSQGDISGWHQARTAAGFRSLAVTLTPAIRTDLSPGINALNAYIRANWASWGCAGLVDLAANSYFDPSDTNKSLDGLHWLPPANAVIAQMFKDVMDPILTGLNVPITANAAAVAGAPTSPPLGRQRVSWVAQGTTTATANAITNDATSTSFVTGGYGAQKAAAGLFTTIAYFEFTLTAIAATDNSFIAGWSQNPSVLQGWQDIDFAVQFGVSAGIRAIVKGVAVTTTFFAAQVGDVVRLEWRCDSTGQQYMLWQRSGTQFYRQNVNITTFLEPDISFASINSQIVDAYIGAATYTNAAAAAASDNRQRVNWLVQSGSTATATALTGTAGAFAGGGYGAQKASPSLNAIMGYYEFTLTARADAVENSYLTGWSDAPAASQGYTDIKYAVQYGAASVASGPGFRAFTSGTAVGPNAGAFIGGALGDVIRLEWTKDLGTLVQTMTWKRNGVVWYSVTVPSTVTVLQADASFASVGSVIVDAYIAAYALALT